MSKILRLGKRLVPRDEIALVERYESKEPPVLQTSRNFQARVVLIDRSNFLVEEAAEQFAEQNGFCLLEADHTALNPQKRFAVETFTPDADFTPRRPYVCRVRWRDDDGNDQSKLLLTAPEEVLTVIARGPAVSTLSERSNPVRGRQRRSSRRAAPALAQS